jgi:hypothetical protein
MTGWVANDTLTGYEYYQANTTSSISALMSFQGTAVWVWGLCGPRGQFWSGTYGSLSVDGGLST